MRALFVTSSYPAGPSDARGIHVHRLAAELVRSGVEVDVVVPGSAGASKRETIDGVRVERVTYWIPRYQSLTSSLTGIVPKIRERPYRALLLLPMTVALALAIRRRHDYDVVHAHWLYPAGLAAVLTRRRAPIVVTSHGGDVNLAAKGRVLRRVVHWIARRVDVLVTVSEALRDEVHEWVPKTVDVRFLPLGVAATDVQSRNRQGPMRLVYVGSLIPRKSVRTLLDAVAAIGPASVAVTIVGDGPERKSLEMQSTSVTADVQFVGYQSPSDIADYIRNADALVLPSLSEGRPVVVMEAMSAARAVVATDIDGTRELVEHGTTGFLFAPGDTAALASILQEMASDRDVGQRLGLAGRRRLETLGLTSEQAAAAHIELYESLLEMNGAAR